MSKNLENVGDLYQLFLNNPNLKIRAKRGETTLYLHDYYIEAGVWYQIVHYPDSPAKFKIDMLDEVGERIEIEASDASKIGDIFEASIDNVKNLKLKFVVGYLGYGDLAQVKTYNNCEIIVEEDILWIFITE